MTVVEREKRKGEKAKGAEFEPRRSQNFIHFAIVLRNH